MNNTFIYYLILFLLLFPFINISGQIELDIRSDSTYCMPITMEDKIYLDPEMSLINAQEPVEYSWECTYRLTDNTILHANDFLDDSTKISPEIIDWLTFPDWITFYLEVKDNNGEIARDSIKIRFSVFSYTLGVFGLYVHQGGSVQISGEFVGGGIAPLTYTWTPETNLSDIHDPAPWCKPDSDIVYSQIAVDSVACISEPNEAFYIFFIPSAIEDNLSTQYPFIQKGSVIEFPEDIVLDSNILIFSSAGRIISLVKQQPTIDLADYTTQVGLNIACFSINEELYNLKFIKQ